MPESKKSGKIRGQRRNFSMVSNVIMTDSSISLRAKGLYSVIQSALDKEQFGRVTYKSDLMKNWCSDGRDAFNTAWKELINTGYLKVHKQKDDKGLFVYEYELLDEPVQEKNDHSHPDTGLPHVDGPHMDKPDVDEPDMDNPLLNKYLKNQISQKNNINQSNIELKKSIDQIDDSIISQIKKQIDYPKLISDNPYDKDRINEIVDLMADVYTTNKKTIHCTRENRNAETVKARYKEIDNSCIQYVLDSFRKQTSEISNMKNYLITSLYNAPVTVSHNYLSKYNHIRTS